MDVEIARMTEMGVYKESELPQGCKAVGCKWVYALKTHPENIKKARLVADGFHQHAGTYGECAAPVAKNDSTRLTLAVATRRDLELYSFDVRTAFLNAPLKETVFMRRIPGYQDHLDKSWANRLMKAIYGLKQAGHEWFLLFSSVLNELGLVCTEIDRAFFVGVWHSSPHSSVPMPPDGSPLYMLLPIHVDDGLVATNSSQLYAWFIDELNQRFKITNLGVATMFLGIRITRDRSQRKLWLDQQSYVLELLDAYNMSAAPPTRIPLSKRPCELPPSPENALPDVLDADLTKFFQRLVGSLLYLSVCTRPDIAYTCAALGQFNASPTRTVALAAKKVLQYLAGTSDMALEYGGDHLQRALGSLSIREGGTVGEDVIMSDADWASDTTDRRSMSGYACYFEGCLIAWSSTKQRVVSLSSTEAEYVSITNSMKQGLWLRTILDQILIEPPNPYPILCDNQGTVDVSASFITVKLLKHIDIRFHFIREHIRNGLFVVLWIPTDRMTADIFTKPLTPVLHHGHVEGLGLVSLRFTTDGGVLERL